LPAIAPNGIYGLFLLRQPPQQVELIIGVHAGQVDHVVGEVEEGAELVRSVGQSQEDVGDETGFLLPFEDDIFDVFREGVVTALFAALAAAAVIAAESQTDVALDTDNNGALSQEEAKAIPGLIEQWDALDLKSDGQLGAAEFASFVAVETKAPAN
jgi:hypothetical protein